MPIDHWGYPLSALLMPCGNITNATAKAHRWSTAGQRFEWDVASAMLKMSDGMPRPGWCLGVRTAIAGPLDPPQHPPLPAGSELRGGSSQGQQSKQGKPKPSPCHLAMIKLCNHLRFRPSIPACNACLEVHKTNLTAANCDEESNAEDMQFFCGTKPEQAPTPSTKWDAKYATTIVTSTE